MPTGYTEIIEKGCTFEEYVWRCARAFGALIMMRDDPLDAPIPEVLSEGNYHVNALAAARAELERLDGMTAADRARAAAAYNQTRRVEYKEALEEYNIIRDRYADMLEKVAAWRPPSADHEYMKQFMLDQIHDSRRYEKPPQEPKDLSAEEWLLTYRNRAIKNIAYHEKAQAEQTARDVERTAWLTKLRASVPYPGPKKP